MVVELHAFLLANYLQAATVDDGKNVKVRRCPPRIKTAVGWPCEQPSTPFRDRRNRHVLHLGEIESEISYEQRTQCAAIDELHGFDRIAAVDGDIAISHRHTPVRRDRAHNHRVNEWQTRVRPNLTPPQRPNHR